MKEFLYLFIGSDDYVAKLPPDEGQRYVQRWYDWIGSLRQAGIYKGGNPLADEGKTISGNDRAVSDGPFAETKELVGGYILIEAASLDDAVEHARGCPQPESGGRVDVREVLPLPEK